MESGYRDATDLILRNKGLGSLKDFLLSRRDKSISYERIGRELATVTEGKITPSYQTVKRWSIYYQKLDTQKQAS